MLMLLQKVSHASVHVDASCVAKIDKGLLVFCAFHPNDNESNITNLLLKCIRYRVFPDNQDKMNNSLTDINGELLLVPQFTLAADTQKGLRPSFSGGASFSEGQKMFKLAGNIATKIYSNVAFGVFGAHMEVSLCNDGPVTFILEN